MRSNRFPLMGLGCGEGGCTCGGKCGGHATSGLGCGCSAPMPMPMAGLGRALGLDLTSLGVGAGVVIAGVAGLGVGWMACKALTPRRSTSNRRRRAN